MFLIKTSLLKQLLEDKRVKSRVDKAKTWREASAVIAEEARKHGIKVVEA